jgi:hypothetical protein
VRRPLVAVDPRLDLARELASALGGNVDAVSLGAAPVEATDAERYLPALMKLITIPLAVNVVSTVIHDMTRRHGAAPRNPAIPRRGHLCRLEHSYSLVPTQMGLR